MLQQRMKQLYGQTPHLLRQFLPLEIFQVLTEQTMILLDIFGMKFKVLVSLVPIQEMHQLMEHLFTQDLDQLGLWLN